MRISIDLTPYRWSGPESRIESTQRVIERAIEAERAGFDAVWLSEDPDGWDAFAVLGAIAGRTERIGLATGVVNPFYRHPAQIAASVSTLDRLSGGRFRLGLGRGQTEWYGRALGIEVDHPVERLEEAIGLLRQWWSDEHRASSSGPLRVDDWRRTFGPIHEPVEIILAAAGPRAVALAGQAADGVLFNELTSRQAIAGTIAATRAVAEGRRLSFVARPVIVVTDNPEPVLERLKERLAIINTLPGMERLIAAPGFDVPSIMARVRQVMHTYEVLAAGGGFIELREAADYDAARKIIPMELVDELAMVGTVAKIRKRLEYLGQLGVGEIVLRRADLPPVAGWSEFLRIWRD